MKNKHILLLWLGAIFCLSQSSILGGVYLGVYNIPIRKIAHVVEFFILYILIYNSLSNLSRGEKLIIAFIFTANIALLDEWHQSFVPGRHSSMIDVAIDSAGALLGFMFICLLKRLSD